MWVIVQFLRCALLEKPCLIQGRTSSQEKRARCRCRKPHAEGHALMQRDPGTRDLHSPPTPCQLADRWACYLARGLLGTQELQGYGAPFPASSPQP